jgi:quinolinate synthase
MLADNAALEVQDIYEEMEKKLGTVVPRGELRYKAELVHEIRKLKKEKNAVILGHNYMEPALFHTIPDFAGDSLDLSRKAAETDKDIIVFCGVRFMAETAKILSPTKKVLLPSMKAGCSLAESITAEDVRELKRRYPGVPVVTYVNTYADVKAETDICCTSSNAAQVVSSLGTDTVIFIPDEYLAKNVARETGKHIIFPVKREGTAFTTNPDDASLLDYQMIGWQGRCEVHELFTVEDIRNARKQFPDVTVLSHPECSPDVVAESDFAAGTNALIRYIEENDVKRFLLLTECSMADNIIAAHPEKETLRMCSIRCRHMNQITLEDTLDALRHERYEIDVPEDIRERAYRSVSRMIAIG